MRFILAIDAGGTSTRAAVFDASGLCVGVGRAGTGNPTAAGIDAAIAAIGVAAEAAVLSAPVRSAASSPPEVASGSSAAIALAGEETAVFRDAVSRRLALLGFDPVMVGPDLLGMFHSGTPALDGYVLIAGTGAVAARVAGGRLERVAGGAGWLLGDAGSGFWIGHRVARAVVADLDGRGRSTALTGLLIDELGVERDGELDHGSPRTLRRLVSVLYSMRPVDLSRFAPLAFTAADDAVALGILADASVALEALLGAVRPGDADDGSLPAGAPVGQDEPADPIASEPAPVVIGGSILIEGMGIGRDTTSLDMSGPLSGVPTIPVADGLLGAAVLAFRAAGTTVDDRMFERLRSTLDTSRRAEMTAPATPAGE